MNVSRLPTVVIENIQPSVDGGRMAIKRVVGEELVITADIFKDGHDIMAAALKWRKVGAKGWEETPMQFVANDVWRGACRFLEIGAHEITIEAWQDTFDTWRHEFEKKYTAGITDLATETLEGAILLEGAAARAKRAPADAARLARSPAPCARATPRRSITSRIPPNFPC